MMKINSQKNKACLGKFAEQSGGFSTLFVVIVLGAVSLGLIFSLTTSSFWSIRSSTNAKNSAQARAAANACAEITLESIRQNNTYAGSGSMSIGSNSCTFSVINLGGSVRYIVTSGTAGTAVRKINITTNAFNPIVVSSWLEVP